MMPSNFKVAHLTSAHPRTDTRIFLKECCSLAKHGYSVSLIVADGKGDEENAGVAIHDVGAPKGRFDRIRHAPRRVLARAEELDADVYHLHDPELLPIGLKLKKQGKRVVFDSHEDVPNQIRGKHYLGNFSKWFLSNGFSVYEKYACRKLDAVIAATPFIRDKFALMGVKSVDVNNYPLLDELCVDSADWSKIKNQIVYLGGLGRVRGIHEMVQAMAYTQTDARFVLGGNFTEASFEQSVRNEAGWTKVDFRGWLDRNGVKAALNESVAGLVTLHPIVNYLDALPVKMFEYMAAGIPVIASNFPLWESIVESNDCGLCVDPLDPMSIATAIDHFIKNPQEAERMGKNGQKAVKERFNWGGEEEKLLAFYCDLGL